MLAKNRQLVILIQKMHTGHEENKYHTGINFKIKF